MKTKKKVVIKKVKKTFNFKAIFLMLALVLGISGFLVYKNYAQNPEIFVVQSDGLEEEEAAFLQKKISTDKKNSTGVTPATVVKVTTKAGNTGVVTLKPKAEDKDKTIDAIQKEIADQVNKAATKPTDTQNPANQSAQGGSTTTTGGGTCSTAGSPVLEGTWVSTGEIFNGDSSQRKCVKCGAAGRYEESMSCSAAFQQGLPMVLPSGGGQAYTGKDISVKPCFIKNNGAFVQVGTGHVSGDAVCTTDGNMTKLSDSKSDLDKYCSTIKPGQVFKDGKCQTNISTVVGTTEVENSELIFFGICAKRGSEVRSDNITWTYCPDKGKEPVEIKCSIAAGLSIDSDGKCREIKLTAAEEAAKKASESGAATIAECKAKIGNSSTLECVPVGYGAYKIVTKIPSSGSKFACGSGAGGTIISIEKQQNGVSMYRQCDRSGCGSDGKCKGVTLGPTNPLQPPVSALSPTNTAFDAPSKAARPSQDGGQRVLNESDCPNRRGGTKVGGIIVCNNSNGTPFDTQKALAEAAIANSNNVTTQANTALIDCPTGSTLINNTCVKDSSSNSSYRKPGEECTNKTNCEATCDGEYSKASVKKPNNLFSWSYYYCGSEAEVEVVLTEKGYPYTIKDTFVAGSNSTPTNNDSGSTANTSNFESLPIQKEGGLVSQQTDDPSNCKYKPTIKSSWNNKWECPSEWSSIQSNTVTNTGNAEKVINAGIGMGVGGTACFGAALAAAPFIGPLSVPGYILCTSAAVVGGAIGYSSN